MTLQLKDANAVIKDLKTTLDSGEHVPHHNIDLLPWPTTITVETVTLTNANTQYPGTGYALPANCKRFEFKARTLADIRFAFVTGKVAGLTEPYLTLKAGTAYDSGPVVLAGTTLYFASSTALTVVEIIAWS